MEKNIVNDYITWIIKEILSGRCMESNENPLERARKRLLDCEALEANQAAHVADLKRRGLNTKKDEEILDLMKKVTGFMREDLLIEQQRAGLRDKNSGSPIS